MTKFSPVQDWTEVRPTPAPYACVLRRSFPNGLHVLILVSEKDGVLHVASSVDHGAVRGTSFKEGAPPEGEAIGDFLARICERWNGSEAARTSAWRRRRHRYYYTDQKGGISGPVSRCDLFVLLEKGEVSWQAQAWEDVESSYLSKAGWTPIKWILGFP